ncbi:MAG TPA: phosphatase PAP2 family protein [Thermoanaerobaculia bacterium]|nr:phosphatase PAP2 family protein [Thermoanaerobaculia bacterium]
MSLLTTAAPVVLLSILFLLVWGAVHLAYPAAASLGRRSADRFFRFVLRGRVARWSGEHGEKIGAWLPVGTILVAGFVVALFAGAAFLEIAEALQEESEGLARFDQTIHASVRDIRNAGATLLFLFFTHAGTPLSLTIIVIVVSSGLALARQFRRAIFLVVTTALGGILSRMLKAIFARERPDLAHAIRHAEGFAFPSGHAMGSTVVFGALLYLALRKLHAWPARSAAIALAITFVIAVSLSRVYLGVHWISDITAGVLAGTVWVVAAAAAYEALRRMSRLRGRRRSTE